MSSRSDPSKRQADLTVERCAAEALDVIPAVMDALRGHMRANAGEQLSVPQLRCLLFISREPRTSLSAVARFLGVTMPTASAMVDRLVRSGAVRNEAASEDRRRAELSVTPTGQSQLDTVRQEACGDMARALASCSAQELRTLHAGLKVLKKAFCPA